MVTGARIGADPLRSAENVLAFWFNGMLSARRGIWFRRDPAFDAGCAGFTGTCLAAREGRLADWLAAPRPALALVLLLDQFPRNLFRDSAEAFASDPAARAAASAALEQGHDQVLPAAARQFFYLPFEHSETLADQDRSVALFAALGDAEGYDYAQRHREVIRRFGRFPHRNAVLGRVSTWDETAYLAGQPAGF